MNRWITLGLAGLLALSMAGCGSQSGSSASQPGEQSNITAKAASASSQAAQAPWGLSLEAKDVTPTGLTLVFTQQGGNPTGQLQYGSDYALEVEQDGAWQAVPYAAQGDWAWTSEAYLVPMDSQTEQDVDWTFLYGSLPAGHYRLEKRVMDFRDTGDYDTQDYEVEFTIS